MSERIQVSIIIPTYNEADRIVGTLKEVGDFLKRQSYSSELLICDDGSCDRTLELIQPFLKQQHTKLLSQPFNRGKGSVVKDGMLAARGQYLFFTDADLSTPITEVTLALEALEKSDIVIGSRQHEASNVVAHQDGFRKFLARGFNGLVQRFFLPGIRDSQCGFKGFRDIAAKELFGLQTIDGFSFDVEILYLAKQRGYSITELPITWRHCEGSKVKLGSHPIAMFFELLKIMRRHPKS